LQAFPEQARLVNAADFVAARNDAFLAVLPDELAERVHQLGLEVFEALVVEADVDGVVGFGIAAVGHPFRGEVFPI
jgi:hypothetical protein